MISGQQTSQVIRQPNQMTSVMQQRMQGFQQYTSSGPRNVVQQVVIFLEQIIKCEFPNRLFDGFKGERGHDDDAITAITNSNDGSAGASNDRTSKDY